MGQVVRSLAALQEQYRGQVEEGRGRVGEESFLALQTAAVREQVGVDSGSEHLALVKHLTLFKLFALYTLGTLHTWHSASYISPPPYHTTVLYRYPSSPELVQTLPCCSTASVLLHLPQSSTATQGHVTALAVLNSKVASVINRPDVAGAVLQTASSIID